MPHIKMQTHMLHNHKAIVQFQTIIFLYYPKSHTLLKCSFPTSSIHVRPILCQKFYNVKQRLCTINRLSILLWEKMTKICTNCLESFPKVVLTRRLSIQIQHTKFQRKNSIYTTPNTAPTGWKNLKHKTQPNRGLFKLKPVGSRNLVRNSDVLVDAEYPSCTAAIPISIATVSDSSSPQS